MYSDQIEIKVLVKNRPIIEYRHRGQTFIEGRAGSEYEIEVTNKTAARVEAVISVDGLSITDGKAAGPSSSGYLLNAFETVRIPGWKLDDKAAAKFAFSGKEESYSTQMSGGDSRNNGVIGIMVFSEKFSYGQPVHQFGQWTTYNPPYGGYNPSAVYNGYPFNSSVLNNSVAPQGRGSCGIAASASASYNATSSMGATRSFGKSPKSYVAEINQSSYGREELTSGGLVTNSLGTAFGEATDFNTTKVEFQRGDMVSMLLVYYDNARGLQKRGINVSRKKYVQAQPEAFPGMGGCAPPPGWRG